YLIKHGQDWLLWDTGVTDAIAAMPEGQRPADPRMTHWRRSKTLAAQLDQLGVKPPDIKYVAGPHPHPAHTGNTALFPQSMLLVQKAEYEWPSPVGPRFKADHPVTKLEGDHDVFGDGSVMIISTPGHTPGHQSLLVKLPKTGAVLLSGDAAHFKENWENRRVPEGNDSKDKTVATMTRGRRTDSIEQREQAGVRWRHQRASRSRLRYRRGASRDGIRAERLSKPLCAYAVSTCAAPNAQARTSVPQTPPTRASRD